MSVQTTLISDTSSNIVVPNVLIAYDAVNRIWTVTAGVNGKVTVGKVPGGEPFEFGGETYILVGEGGLTAAVAKAEDGDTILLLPGAYDETVVVNKDVTILGANAGIDGSGERGAETIIKGGIQIVADGATLDGLSIQKGGSFVAEPAAGVFVQAADVTITNSILTGPARDEGSRGIVTDALAKELTVSGNVMTGWATGTYLNPGATGTVDGNVFQGNNVGLSMDDPVNLTITGNEFKGNIIEQIGAGATGTTLDLSTIVTDNTFVGAAGKVVVWGASGSQTITGSEVADLIKGGEGVDTVVYGTGAAIVFDAVKKVWTVTAGGVTDTLEGIERVTVDGKTYVLAGGGAHNSLNAAIDDAVAGQTILVAAGKYDETVIVNKDVTILGANAGVGGYDRLNSSMETETVIKGGIQIVADGVTLDGLSIQEGVAFIGETAGVFVQAADVTIINTVLNRTGTVDGDGSRGIVTAASAKNLIISGNVMTGWATGTYLNPGSTGTVKGNVFTTNLVGISMDDPAGLKVTDNVLFGNKLENVGVGVSSNTADVGSIIGVNTFLSTVQGGDVSIYGLTSGHDIQGTAYDDTFYGSKEADIFTGGAGNDVINGDGGNDTAVFSGNRANYQIVSNGGTVTITDLRQNGTGTDSVSGIEIFKFANGSVSVEKLNVNDAPTAVFLGSQVTTTEENGADVKVATITVTDDLLGTETLSLVGADAASFQIRGSDLWFIGGGDFESKKSYSVQVKATDDDGKGEVTSAEFKLNISNVNETPTDISLSGGYIKEFSAREAIVATLLVEDEDAGETFTYELIDNADGRFAISGDKIVVANGVKLDYEQAESHEVKVQVTDSIGATYKKVLTISVSDVAVERVIGTSGHDVIFGGKHNDVISGGSGNDVLAGFAGTDILTGGSGSDKFSFETKLGSSNIDRITDFDVRRDTIELDNAIFTKLGKLGTLNKSYFAIGSAAKDKNDYIIYDNRKGVLYYDADGSGQGKAISFAMLDKDLKMTYSDFLVF